MKIFWWAISLFHLPCIASASEPHIDWVDCRKHVPRPLFQSFPDANVTVLPPTLHCGRITVPMNYDKPISSTNNITLGLAMYRPVHSKGTLFYCPGGTDAGAVIAWQVALDLNSDFTPNFDGLLDYDIMSMDIRGTYSSNALDVDKQLVEALLGQYPANKSQYETFQANARRMFASWNHLSSPPGIIPHVGTRETVQDYETIRLALGYERINFLGASYGSYRAAQYAATFPCRVGNFALDAVVPHGLDLFTLAQVDIKAANRGLERADAFCQNNASCPFHVAGTGSVLQTWTKILERADNSTLHTCAANSTECKSTLSAFEVQAATLGLLENQPDFPFILNTFAEAIKGNGIGFISSSPPPTIAEFWAVPLWCNDHQVENKTFAAFVESYNAAKKIDTWNIPVSATWQVHLICSAWPYSTPPNKVLELHESMLLVTADFDVNAATERTTFQWQSMPNSALVVRHGDDHVSFNLPEQASTRITKEFLRTGILPTARNDTFVTVYEPGTVRASVSDPHDVPTGFVAGDIDSA